MLKKQLEVCERLLSQKPLGSSILYGPTKLCDVTSLEEYSLLKSHVSSFFGGQIITLPWVEIFGTKYQVGMDVVVKKDLSSPLFARIKHLLAMPNKVVHFVLCCYDSRISSAFRIV